MNIFIKEHKQLLHALLNNHVNFMLIGGYAVIYYGYERTTGDMDIWLQLGEENKIKLLKALDEFGIEEDDIKTLTKMDFNNPLPVFYIGKKPRSIDFVTMVSNLSFDEAAEEVSHFHMDGMNIPVIQFEHLILSKLTTGRAKDKADIEELNRINKHRRNK